MDGCFGTTCSTFQRELYSFTAVDTQSKYVYIKLCPNRDGVFDHLESLRLFVAATGRTLRFIRTDNKLVTSSAVHWAHQHNIQFHVLFA